MGWAIGFDFCSEHLTARPCRIEGEIRYVPLCARCGPRRRTPFKPKPDASERIAHKLTDPSWQRWRDDNPGEVAQLRSTTVEQHAAV